MARHKVSIRTPLWKKAKAYADLEEMTVSDLVEDLLSELIEGSEDEDEEEEDSDKD